jgi:heptosyltransferase-2
MMAEAWRTVTNGICALGWAGYHPIRRRRLAELTAGIAIRSVLVFNDVRGLGNLIQLTGLLANLRRLYPKARIAVAMPQSSLAPLVIGKHLADEILPFEASHHNRRALVRFAWSVLRPMRFELGLATFFSPTLLASCALAVAGCRYRVAYAQTRRRGVFNTITLEDTGGHELDRHLRLLDFTGSRLDRKTFICADPESTEHAEHFLAEYGLGTHRPVLGVHPGSDRGNAAKRWPVERFVAVANRLTRDNLADVLLILGPDEAELDAELVRQVDERARVVRLESVRNVVGLIGHCQALLTNDTGLMHVAAALGVPVVAIFGPTDSEKNAPLGPATLLMADDVPCRPCYVGPPLTCFRERRYCLENISVERVVHAVQERLQAPNVVLAPRRHARRM